MVLVKKRRSKLVKKPKWNGDERRDNSPLLEKLDDLKTGLEAIDTKQDAMNDKLIKFETQVFDPETGILTIVKKHDKIIFGNGEPGLIRRIDKMEEKQEGRWSNILLTGSLVLVFGSTLAFVISHFGLFK